MILALNCKNVKQEKHKPEDKLNKARIRRGKSIGYEYHTITVRPLNSRNINSESTFRDTKNQNKIHFCRGHFKVFTEEKPLFGKYTGIDWWEHQLRGKNTEGFINKDYKIKSN